ncbi:hybrid sensor histidine kinase/response regulator [Pseudoroseomonas rhizosphaerae]|uniref:histidine kinase n=1 Tax=Teichococcus rhizosphaerae TaxID=1335062 RepID=A0A2C7AD43_9PROT|nr:hybrid sensor histidine kinase/response regulator [Pseudoroseomonas rhizosphaerae]PHK95583.1 hybrid sensor histidine kinase/response regulator [Pseudoroseomonas rhizosphaerae]
MPLRRAQRIALVASVLVPASVFAIAAWWNRAEVLREGGDAMTRSVAAMHEHAAKVFDTAELILYQAERHVQEMEPQSIATPAVNAYLRRLVAPLDQVVSIWVADAQGQVLAGSQSWERGTTIAGREFFQGAKDQAEPGSYVSAPFVGRATHAPSFAISRRRLSLDGHFIGTVHVAMDPTYFAQFYAQTTPPFLRYAALVRMDGTILTAHAAPERPMPLTHFPVNGPFRPLVLGRPEGHVIHATSPYDEAEAMFAFRRIREQPVFVALRADMDNLLERWRRNMIAYGTVAGVASLTLLMTAGIAMRRAQAERVALQRAADESARRLAMEERLRQAQKLEALGQLAGGVAHDFNNAAAVMLAGITLLEKRHGAALEQHGPEAARLLGALREGAERGVAVARRLLAFVRREGLRAVPIAALPLLEEVREVVTPTLGAGQVGLSVRGEPGLPPLLADRGQLVTVLINLVLNARDAMPQGGSLVLAARRVAAGEPRPMLPDPSGTDSAELPPGCFVCLEVADTGVGMDSETLARATEPFFTTKPPGKGTGLGLSMAFAFANQSGGGLLIRSAPGQGTTVSLWLPCATANQPAA